MSAPVETRPLPKAPPLTDAYVSSLHGNVRTPEPVRPGITPEERFARLRIDSPHTTPIAVRIKGRPFHREEFVTAISDGEVSGKVQVNIGRVTESLSIHGKEISGMASAFVWNIEEGVTIRMDGNVLLLAEEVANGTILEVNGEKNYFNDPTKKNPLIPDTYVIEDGMPFGSSETDMAMLERYREDKQLRQALALLAKEDIFSRPENEEVVAEVGATKIVGGVFAGHATNRSLLVAGETYMSHVTNGGRLRAGRVIDLEVRGPGSSAGVDEVLVASLQGRKDAKAHAELGRVHRFLNLLGDTDFTGALERGTVVFIVGERNTFNGFDYSEGVYIRIEEGLERVKDAGKAREELTRFYQERTDALHNKRIWVSGSRFRNIEDTFEDTFNDLVPLEDKSEVMISQTARRYVGNEQLRPGFGMARLHVVVEPEVASDEDLPTPVDAWPQSTTALSDPAQEQRRGLPTLDELHKWDRTRKQGLNDALMRVDY